jgi:3-phenylpropionate/trans-cinnamate dioxygenase ferredoxin subunit
VVTVDRRSICVFNSDGRYYAVRNVCPHQGARLACGTLGGTMLPSRPQELVFGREGQILRCAWHGWEFDLETGSSMFDPSGVRVRTYPVTVEEGVLMLEA